MVILLEKIFRVILLQLLLAVCVFAENSADYITLKEKIALKVNLDKSYSKKVSVEKKILSYGGKKDLSEFKIFYDSRYENVEIVQACTEKPDGSIIRTTPDVIKELDSPYEGGMMEFAVGKMLVIPFLSVEVGDTVSLEFIKTNNSGFDIFDTYTFSGNEKAFEKAYSLEYPKDLDLKISESRFQGKVKKLFEKNGAKNKVTYISENIQPYQEEERMPSPARIFPTVYVSTYSGVKEYGKAIYSKYFESLDRDNTAVQKLSEKLLSGVESDLDKVRHLNRYFSKEFMYIPTDDFFKFQPRDFSEILNKGYGTPVEAYMIFSSLLEKQGIENSVLVVGDEKYNLKDDLKKGNIYPFSYLISRVKIGGQVYYVDISNQFYELEESEFDGKIAMVLGEKIRFDKIDSQKKNMREIVYRVVLNDEGRSIVEKENFYSGAIAGTIRARYRYMTEYELKKHLEQLMTSISIFAQPIGEAKIDLESNASISYKYQQENYASKDGEFIYFDIDNPIAPYSLELFPDERGFAYESDKNFILKRKYHIELPENYEVLLAPRSIKHSDKLFSVFRRVGMSDGSLNIEDEIIYKSGQVKSSGYERFYKKNLKLSHPNNTRVLLRKIVEK